ncbi:MAG: hypothetical protein AAGK79_10620 [Pseudomonadota bacterium]
MISSTNVSSRAGILASNQGSGALTVTSTGTVTGTGSTGIYAVQGTNALGDLSVSVADVQSSETGIVAINNGSGSTLITATGTVSSGQNGIVADNTNGGALTISANTVTGTGTAADGINASNDASGTSLSIRTTGTITGDSRGIEVENLGVGDLLIDTSNASAPTTVTGGVRGILATNQNGGALTITTDNVYGGSSTGISAFNGPGTTGLTINARGTTQAASASIAANSYGSGDLIINAYNAAGTAYVGGSTGISARSRNGGAVFVNTDAVTGTGVGVSVFNDAAGTSISVAASGMVTGGNLGMYVRNLGTEGITIDATNATGTNQVIGGQTGIRAQNENGGAITISANTVTGTAADGINANNDSSGTSLSITTTGTVTGGVDGIAARNDGSGNLTINATNASGTAQVLGGEFGIRAGNYDAGALIISANTVTGTTRDGIRARSGNGTTSMSITVSGTVTGALDGINAQHRGGRDLTINATNSDGTAQVTGGVRGMYVESTASHDVTILANSVRGDTNAGIDFYKATNFGSVTINATNADGTAQVTGATQGIEVYSSSDGDLQVTADNVLGNNGDGITSQTLGSGEAQFTTYGTVSGSDDGFDIRNEGTLRIYATNADGTASVTGGRTGIRAVNLTRGFLIVTVDNADGATEDGVFARSDGAGVLINANGVVSGGRYGIDASTTNGNGVEVNATNASGTASVTGGQTGIRAMVDAGGGRGVTITADNVSGGIGIDALTQTGGTYVNVTTNGTVTGTTGNGINAVNNGTDGISITSTNTDGTAQVTGAQNGIFADNNNGGDVTISANTVTGTAADGIYVNNNTAGGTVSVTTTGTVMGGDEGIEVQNEGMGGVTVNTSNASGTGQVTSTNTGIRVENENGGAVSITADNVTTGASGNGILADNDENGTSTSIRTYGTIYAGNFGIRAFTQGTGDLTIDTTNATAPTTVTGGRSGVSAENLMGGALLITTDNVYGGSTSGISASNTAGTTTLTINARGTTQSDRLGISASNQGSGNVTINAYNAAGTASVLGGYRGISVGNRNGGAVNITANAVTGTTGEGIDAYNDASGTSVSITALGPVSGGTDGIDVINNGTEGITIDATNAAGTNQVTGGTYGIFADNNNGGDVTITANTVTGTSADGINANNDLSGGSLSVSASGTVTGGEDGIEAVHTGSGSVTVTASNADGTAQVTGEIRGIFASSRSGDTTVTANAVTGNNGQGIHAYSGLGGAVSVTADGTVSGTTQGIEATARSVTGSVTVDATNATGTNQVTGGVSGIVADADVGGAVSVTANNVTGTTQYGILARTQSGDVTVSSTGTVMGGTIGVYAVKSGGASDSGALTVDASNADGTGQVTGGTTGIFARNMGGSTIVIADNVTGTSQFGISASVEDLITSQDVTVTARGVVQGGSIGIRSTLYSAGNHTINAYNAAGTASVTGGTGISATSRSSTGALTITTNAVTGINSSGIFVDDRTISGSTTINASGPVSGFSNGITISSISRGDVSVDATNMAGTNTVTGGQNGINVNSSNGGALTIRANNVEGTAYTGIRTFQGSGTGLLSLTTTGTVTGGMNGIYATTQGSGDAVINTSNASGTGVVTGGTNGIVVQNTSGGGSVSITTDAVTGNNGDGIDVFNNSAGDSVTVTAYGAVSGTMQGIAVINEGTGDVTIDASNADQTVMVTGGTRGIYAVNTMGGALRVTADNVTGTTGDGIYANNDVNGTLLSVTTAGTVTGGDDGIDARHYGTGDLVINSANVDGTGSVIGQAHGIFAENRSGGASTVTAGNVTSTDDTAIDVSNYAGGDVTITTTGTVEGRGGIRAYGASTGDMTINATNADGTASVDGGVSTGIYAGNYTTGALSIAANNVSGGVGIFASTGTLNTTMTVTTTGTVTGTVFEGIRAEHEGTGDLTINATNADGTGQVTGQSFGIRAENYGGGALSVSADNVTGTTLIGIFAENAPLVTTDLSVQTTGTVTAGAYGIVARNQGSGDLTVNSANADDTGSVSGNLGGILAYNSNGGATTLVADRVESRDSIGIRAFNADASTTSLSVTASNVTGGADGVYARNEGTGDLTVSVSAPDGTGQATGAQTGIDAVNQNGGALSIIADNVTGTNQNGINAYNAAPGTSLSITTTGTVSGGDDGVFGINRGTGDLRVNSANADGTGSVSGATDGIYVVNFGLTALNVTADDVSGTAGNGIYTENTGDGGSAITTYGTVTGGVRGIRVTDRGQGDLTVTANNSDGTAQTIGGQFGIIVANYYDGAVTITADNVVGTAQDGISARNYASDTAMTITTYGTVTGGVYGIDARNPGGPTAPTTIMAVNSTRTAQVTGGQIGIFAYAEDGALSIAADNVTGNAGDGIRADGVSFNLSDLSVRTYGTVTGGEDGIDAYMNGTGDLTVNASNADGTGQVSGASIGIRADNNRGGALSVTADNVIGTAYDGIEARNDGSGTTLSVMSSGDVSGGIYGIEARNDGTGDTTINAASTNGTAQVTGGRDGIFAENRNGGTLSITADSVSGSARDGIFGYNDAAGTSLAVQTYRAVAGAIDGIYVYNYGSGDLSVSASNAYGTASVTGQALGIYANNENGGALSVTANIAIGVTAEGIVASNRLGGSTLSVAARIVTGGTRGITAVNDGTGDLTVDTTAPGGVGLVSAGTDGIYAINNNGGALIVMVDNVTATTGDAIYAYNTATGYAAGPLSITATGAVSGGDDGIHAENRGYSLLTVDATNPYGTASVTGQNYGIFANNPDGYGIIISANSVTGVTADGIYASANSVTGSSPVSIATTGAVTGGQYGIRALNQGGFEVSIAATNTDGTATVLGGTTGIYAINEGGGALSITADTVTGTGDDGIFALNDASGTTFSIMAYGDVIGLDEGINATNLGNGDMTVSVSNAEGTASVTGQTDFAVYALNFQGGALNVALDNARGGNGVGLYAYNGIGTDALNITSSGTIEGTVFGIAAIGNGAGDLTLAASTVTGDTTGIYAINRYGGALDVTATTVTGGSGDALYLRNGTGTSLSVEIEDRADGGDNGIDAVNYGSGDLTVVATRADGSAFVGGVRDGVSVTNFSGGSLTVIADNVYSSSATAIRTYNDLVGSTTTIATYGDVYGENTAIDARHYGTRTLSVSVSGKTVGVYGILTYTDLGGTTDITLNDGAYVNGFEVSIRNDAGDSNTRLADGSALVGNVQLGDGSDDFTIEGSNITLVSVLDGGDDSDTADGFIDLLTFEGFEGSFGANLLNWEEVVFDASDATFTGGTITTPTVTLQNGTRFGVTEPGFVFNTELSIDDTSLLDVGVAGAGRVMLNGNVTNNGSISQIDGATGDRLIIDGDLTGDGALGLDVDVSDASADTVTITGNAIDRGGINVSGFGDNAAPDDIKLVSVAGQTNASAFALNSTNFVTPDGEDAQVIGAFTYTLEFDAENRAFFLMPLGGNPVLPVFEAYPALLTALNLPGTTFQSWSARLGNLGNGTSADTPTQALFDFEPSADNAIWFSFNGTRSEYQGRSTLNSSVETDGTRFEMGVNFPVFEGETGQLIAGASFSLHDSQSQVVAGLSNGRVITKGQSATLSAIWLSNARFYAHGQARFSTFSTDMLLAGLGPVSLGSQGEGVAASLEVGQAFAVSDTLTLVPQFQLTHSDVRGDGIADPFGAPFAGRVTDGETSLARIGLHAETSLTRGSLYGAVSYVHAFDNDTEVTFMGTPFRTEFDENRIEVTAGGQFSIGENGVLYGGITYQGGLSNLSNDMSYGVTGGLRVNF